MKKTVSVIGLGYIGLPTSVVLANQGFNVIGIDINKKIIEDINLGKSHINEPGIKESLQNALKKNKFKAQEKYTESDVFLISVPTPFKIIEGSNPIPNINHVIETAKSISSVIKPNNLVLIESTCPVGTTEKVASIISQLSDLSTYEFNIAYCPERVIPGQILNELINVDRVIGGLNKLSTEEGVKFYSAFCKGNLHKTNCRTAELVKISENSYRDVNIAFANELSIICDELNIDVFELIDLANHHPRVKILKPGCGVGGHCIAVDPWFIASKLPEQTPLIQSSRKVNTKKTEWISKKITSLSNELEVKNGRKPKIGCLGITFKQDVEDLRESPALKIVQELINSGIDIVVCEPNIKDHPSIKIDSLKYVIDYSDLIVILVPHKSFKSINFNKINYLDFCGVSIKS